MNALFNVSAIFAFFLFPPAQQHLESDRYASAKARATRVLDDATASNDLPGLQYVVVDSNGTLFEYAGGWADIVNEVPMTLETPMMAYSMTKTFTAAGILSLIHEGKLDLDSSVYSLVPEIPYGRDVTVRHLLAHLAGIPNPIPLRWVHAADQTWGDAEEDEALRAVLADNDELSAAPGEECAYSNIDYWLLGKVIARASGMSYKDYVTHRILTPLQRSEGELGFDALSDSPPAKGYLARWTIINLLKYLFVDEYLVGEYEPGSWLHVLPHRVNGTSFGGLIGTARGFGRFLQDQLRTFSALFGEPEKRLFYEQQRTNDGKPVFMTLGWHIGNVDGNRYYFKEGGGGGFRCEMRIYPAEGIATVIMGNETSGRVVALMDEIDGEFLRGIVTHQ